MGCYSALLRPTGHKRTFSFMTFFSCAVAAVSAAKGVFRKLCGT